MAPRSNESESSDEVRGPLGLNLLHEPPEPLIDFIFVHGLRGGSRKTWSKTDNPGHFWPKTWLPTEPRFKNVRIYSFGYNSDWGERKGTTITIHDFGQALLGDIQNTPCLGGKGRETPLVLIGHSMGGVIIKKVLLLARQDPLYHRIAARIHSMFFLATPHRGADSAQLLSNMLKLAVSHGSKPYVDGLMPRSDAIQVINDGFRHAYQGVQLWSFFETVKTSLGLIVEKDSATLDLPGERVQLLNADHRHVCKFESPADSNYCTLRNAFVSTIDSIEKCWYAEKQPDHGQELRLLSTYLGLLDTPEVDLANVVDFQIEGSCQWLIKSPSFQDWRAGLGNHPKYYWLSGDPATGKSTLAGHVIRHLEETSVECSYFFFKHGLNGRSTVAELLCSLAWQMASSNTDIRQKLVALQRDDVSIDKTDERSIWRTIFATRIFRTELRQPLYWVIDGLDECTNYATLFPLLGKIEKQFPLSVFLTSRPSLAIERSFSREKISRYHEPVSHDNTLGDISLLIIAHSHYFPVETDVARKDLEQRILEKSNGNFLWTRLVVKELEEAMSEQQTHEILESVPKEMDELYTRILANLTSTPRNTELVMAILRWVMCASRPLTVEELKEALRLDIGEILPQLERTAGSICGNLIYVDSQLKVRPAHQTVREYLYREDNLSNFAIQKNQAHSRIGEVCLGYLQCEEMRNPRHRRGSLATRHRKLSAFANYASEHFSDHIARSSSSADAQLLGLDAFLEGYALTWLEVIAASQDLSSVIATAKNLKIYLERRAKYQAPIGKAVQRVSGWASDLIRLAAQFGKVMTTSPSAIHFLIPPVCPAESVVREAFSGHPRALRLVGLSQRQWDDRLSCIIFPEAQTLSVACRDDRYAIGLSNGSIYVYAETSFQVQSKFFHGEPVRVLSFGTINTYVASAGRKKICLWNTSTAVQLWAVDVTDQTLALAFSEDDSVLMAATRANSLCFWAVETGSGMDIAQFSDIEEEDQSEYHYKRPPIHAEFCPALSLLGVAYRNRPISFWDLEDNTFVGQYHKAGAVYPEPLIHDFIFNPNPEISLAAVIYEGGEVVTFDPFTQRTDAVADANASTLAASPDGTVLACGSGDGVIKIYDFETLKLFYQINSDQQAIRAFSFNSNNLRFLDIRGNQCNVWEPSVLVRRNAPGDDSSLDFSENIPGGPEYTESRVSDDDLNITAIAAYDHIECIFSGRENGSVALYSSISGQLVQELFTLSVNVAVCYLEWNDCQSLLAVADRSGGCEIRRIYRDAHGNLSSSEVFQVLANSVQQVLLSPDGTGLLLSTSFEDQVWTLENKQLVFSEPRTHGRWISHPHHSDRLLLITNERARIFEWQNFHEITKSEGISLQMSNAAVLPVSQCASSLRGQNICVHYSGTKAEGLIPALRLWPTSLLSVDATIPKPAASYDALAQEIKCIVGVYKSLLVFLSHQGWVCSLNIDDLSSEKFYARHFFVPLHWHSTLENMSMLVTGKGGVVLAVKHELAIFHFGFEFEERVGFEGAAVSAKASMRSVLKRGTSNPV